MGTTDTNRFDEPLIYSDETSPGCNECGTESLNVELSNKVSDDNYAKGVIFTTLGQQVKLVYDGLLVKSGADQVYAVVSTRDEKNLLNTSTYSMKGTNQKTFEVSIPAVTKTLINVAFKDSASNWDNNSGQDYSYYIQ